MAYALCGSGLWRLPGARLVGGWPHSSHRLSHRAGALSPLTPESTTVDAAGRPHTAGRRRAEHASARFPPWLRFLTGFAAGPRSPRVDCAVAGHLPLVLVCV